MKLNSLFLIIICSFGVSTSLVFAKEVPVKRFSSNNSLEERVEDLQVKVQELNGELEVANYRIQKLEKLSQKITNEKLIDAEQKLYYEILDCLPMKLKECESKLQEYLKYYPTGKYVANAYYCLGELNLLQNRLDKAEENFQVVINRFSVLAKAREAEFKIALVYYAQGRKDLAIKSLHKLLDKVPDSILIPLIKQQLKQWEN